MIDVYDKNLERIIETITFDEMIKRWNARRKERNSKQVGTKGRLNTLLDMAKGGCYQNVDFAYRLANLKAYESEWVGSWI
jgi:hypothetical protein